jgi:hypothetical protein
MLSRCYDENNKYFKWYGGKGVTVCDEWLECKEKFIVWALRNGFEESLTLDRIDSDKGYSPNNCEWVTRQKQAENRFYEVHKKQFRGVTSQRKGKYIAQIQYNGKKKHIGTYDTPEDAALAYNNFVIEHKLNRHLNKITGGEKLN